MRSKKLKLKLIQDADKEVEQIKQVQEEKKTDDEISLTEREKFGNYPKQLYSKYKEMFTRVGEIRNFEYNVEFVPKFRPF